MMKPIAEVTALRGNYFPIPAHGLNNQQLFVAADAEAVELLLEWERCSSLAEQYGMVLGDGLRIYVDNQAQRLVLERNYPDFSLVGTRSIPLPEDCILSLRIFIDRSSVEVFVNEGE